MLSRYLGFVHLAADAAFAEYLGSVHLAADAAFAVENTTLPTDGWRNGFGMILQNGDGMSMRNWKCASKRDLIRQRALQTTQCNG